MREQSDAWCQRRGRGGQAAAQTGMAAETHTSADGDGNAHAAAPSRPSVVHSHPPAMLWCSDRPQAQRVRRAGQVMLQPAASETLRAPRPTPAGNCAHSHSDHHYLYTQGAPRPAELTCPVNPQPLRTGHDRYRPCQFPGPPPPLQLLDWLKIPLQKHNAMSGGPQDGEQAGKRARTGMCALDTVRQCLQAGRGAFHEVNMITV